MKPSTHITHILSSRPSGGFFIPAIFPEKTRAELTKVNKPVLSNSFTSNYEDLVLLTVKPTFLSVNKKRALTTHDSRLTTNNITFATEKKYIT